ncbi:MAG: PQQ-binding-like beta-propeller repeat protein [Phycisphaeraceae bacterium]|nr:PQQ-binding-like beta-propeller repeat protein [Phycisphaeraceae bacterium]
MSLTPPARRSRARLRPTVAGAVLLSLVSAAGGCETDGQPAAAASPEARAASVPVHTSEYATLGYRIEWRGFPTMFAGERVRFAEVLGDLVMVQDTAGVVSAIEVRSGERRWSDQPAQRLTKYTGMTREGNRVIVASESEVFFYDSETGNLLDKQRLERVVNTRPMKIGEVLVFGCSDGQVLGHLTVNGFRLWGSGLDGAITADPVRFGDTDAVALVSSRGEILVTDGRTGNGMGRARIFGGPGAPLAASDSSLFIASVDHSLYAFSRDRAAQLWRHRTEEPLRRAPAFYEGRVYCDLGGPGLTAFDSGSGSILWQNKNVRGEVVAMRKGRLVVWDNATSTATLVDPARGETIESVKLDRIVHLRADQFVDGPLYAVSANGVVAKLVTRN